MTPTKADPAQQEMFDLVMANVRGMVFDDTGVNTVIDKIRSADGGPAQGIGHTAAMMVKSVSGGVQKQGKQIPQPVMFGALRGAVGDLTEVAAASKIIPEEQKSQVAQQALPQAVKFLSGGAPQAEPRPAPQLDGIINNAMRAV